MDNSSNGTEEAPSLNTLCLRSRKRTLEFFLGTYESQIASLNPGIKPPPEDNNSLKIKLSCKINDEFFAVKDLPTPTIQASVQSLSSNLPSAEVPVDNTLNIKGTHPFPKRPGYFSLFPIIFSGVTASKTDENNDTSEISELSSDSKSHYQGIIEGIPKASESKNSWGIVDYRPASAKAENFTTKALALRNPYEEMKPDWHAPWKLMRVISGHLGWVRSIAVDSSNEWFVTGSNDRTIKIWDLASGVLKLTLTGHIGNIRGLAVSPRHPYLFSCAEDKKVLCWDLEYNKVIRHYHGHLSGVYCLDLHPSLDILVTGGRDASARVWDIRTKANIFVLSGHNNTIGSVACQATDPQIISGSQDSTIRLWDLAKGQCSSVLTHHKKSVRALTLHPTEYAMASASPDNIKKWKFPEGKFLHNLAGHNAIINTLAVNKDNVLVSGADNGSMWFWDWKTGYCFQKLQTTVQPGSLDSEAGIFCSTFDQSSSRLIVGEADKTIKIYKEDENAV